jgi:hypothetical protein
VEQLWQGWGLQSHREVVEVAAVVEIQEVWEEVRHVGGVREHAEETRGARGARECVGGNERHRRYKQMHRRK